MDRSEILKEGEINVEVKRSGIKQKITFKIKKHQTTYGKIPFLTSSKFVDLNELIKIAEKYQLPVKAKNGQIFPRGKMAKDFIDF